MRALQITRKDLCLLSRDKRAAAVLLALPLIFITIIGISTGQILSTREGGERVKVAVVNLVRATTATPAGDLSPAADTGTADTAEETSADADAGTEADSANRLDGLELAAEIIEAVRKHDHFEIADVSSVERATEDLDQGNAVVVLIIGERFPEAVAEVQMGDILSLSKGRLAAGPGSVDITFLTKPTLAKIGDLAAGVMWGDIVRTLSQHIVGDSKNVFVRQQIRLAEQRAANRDEEHGPVEFQLTQLLEQKEAPGGVLYSTLVPSYTVLFVFFLVNIMARSFIAERDLGTLRRLRLAPIGAFDLLVGKNIPFFCLSLVQTSLLFLCGRMVFRMSWGAEPWLIIPVIVCTSLAATALGLMVATIIRTDSQVSAYGNSLVIIMAGVSGCFMPRDWLPDLMKQISLGTPHAWALIAYDEILSRQHVQLEVVIRSCAMLIGFAVLFFSVGWIRFRTQRDA
jgi:ABC-2 type transport system permease protein